VSCAGRWKYREANAEELAAKRRLYYQQNRARIRRHHKAYHRANKEQANRQKKAYREANKERINRNKKEYRAANKEIIAERDRRFREANLEQARKRVRDYKKKNPDKVRANGAKRRALKVAASGAYTEAECGGPFASTTGTVVRAAERDHGPSPPTMSSRFQRAAATPLRMSSCCADVVTQEKVPTTRITATQEPRMRCNCRMGSSRLWAALLERALSFA
jgi:hypothetical protein